MTSSARATFIDRTVAWINQRLAPAGVAVTADTPLFIGGLINSIRVLELIAWTERAIGAEIPDQRIRMDNFCTVRRIAEVFVVEAEGGSDVAA
jgi:acyl carrier protein